MRTRTRVARALAVTAAAGAALLVVSGCAPGGNAAAPKPTGSVSTAAPKGDITIKIQDETGFPVTSDLTAEFTKQYPNVKFDIVRDSFQNLLANTPRLLASADAPRSHPSGDHRHHGQGRPAHEPRSVLRRLRMGQVLGRPARGRSDHGGRCPRRGLALPVRHRLQRHGYLHEQEARGSGRHHLGTHDHRRTRVGSSEGEGCRRAPRADGHAGRRRHVSRCRRSSTSTATSSS